jgi:hypothetical protein
MGLLPQGQKKRSKARDFYLPPHAHLNTLPGKRPATGRNLGAKATAKPKAHVFCMKKARSAIPGSLVTKTRNKKSGLYCPASNHFDGAIESMLQKRQ